ncbi:4-hydroxybenzoate octaprenyltransferase [Paramagnetospirillum marisnigri]|uniref:4-hydroxybenzoate octaprenyltransferase n=1 Tax=Paramagnetospirillum marisnigri TaxID=1285242 RepID=A0A178MCL7_9PROT|nr:4-hydroxybenzoate octaprenyltransferase [Paramagnetospirillum marisnigri]OAN45604.1 4-hydroxybenzoate octaprenyltransferase [Paramagnetospirillum marisnigri]
MSTAQTLKGDIPVGNWIDRLVPAPLRPYLRLMRLDRPIGTWLLLFPCWWSAALAAPGLPDPWLLALFGLGAVVMRGAGCTFNDWADRDFDGRVARTASRPIPSGAVSPRQALAFLGLQLLIGLGVLLQLNPFAIAVGVASLLLVFPYPFMKRITHWPQAWLGLTFNWGALLGWAAVRGDLDLPALLLYAAGPFWTLGYDTIYAHQDKEDDALIGVKSTALALGDATPKWLWLFYGAALALMASAGASAGLGWAFWPGMALAGAHLVWQIVRVDIHDAADCLAKFKSNRHFGWLVLAAIIAGRLSA